MWYTGYDGESMRIGYTISRRLGDISGDGTISPYDAALILRFVVGIIDEFPTEELSSPKGVQTLPSYRVSLPERSAGVGDRISVPVRVEDGTGLFAGGIRVGYDPTVLKAVDVSALGLLSGSYWQGNTELDGEVRLAFATIAPLVEGGDLFGLTFEVLSDTEGGETSLMLSEVEFNDSVPVQRGHGLVRILPSVTELLENYPNPFNPETWIPYRLSAAGYVRIRIYDVLGQLVRELDVGDQPAGVYLLKERAAHWDGRDGIGEEVSSGVYVYELQAGEFTSVRRMTLLK